MSDLLLTKLDQARMLLAEAHTVADIKQIADVAEAMRVYAQQAQLGQEAINYAAEIKIRAERKLGELLAQMPKNEGVRMNGRDAFGGPRAGPPKPTPTLAELGITKNQSARAQQVATLPEAVFEDQIAQRRAADAPISVADMIRAAKELQRSRERAERSQIVAAPASDRYRLLHADIAACDLPDASVDLIVTDPPYPREYLPVYATLAQLAARVLKPGGSALVMIGQSYLPEVLALMTPHLRYHWTLAYLTPGGQAAQIWPRKINTFWKPVLWLSNGDYTGDWIGDVTRSATNDNDKRFHDWGQSESGMAQLVERLAAPNTVLFDPFCGGGTTLVVGLRLGLHVIGMDRNADALATTARRLELEAAGTSASGGAAAICVEPPPGG